MPQMFPLNWIILFIFFIFIFIFFNIMNYYNFNYKINNKKNISINKINLLNWKW